MNVIKGADPRFFVRADGSYIGSYSPLSEDDVGPFFEVGEIEVPFAPEHASQTWSGAAWSAPPSVPVPPTPEQLARALLKKGVVTQADIDAEKGA